MTARNRTTSTSLPRKRRRPAKSCEQCRERKVRCDLQLPCRACRHARDPLTCTYRESSRPRPSQTDARTAPKSPDMPASTPTERSQPQQQFHGLRSIPSTQLDQHDVASTGTGTSGSSLQDLENRLRKTEQQLSELSRTRQPGAVSGDLAIPAIMPRLRNTAEKTKLFGPSHWMYTAEKIAGGQIDSKDMDFSMVDMKADIAEMAKECRNLRKAAKSQRTLQLNDPVPDLFSTFPDRQICDELARAYIRTFEQIYRVVHIPSFWKEYYQFWEAPHASSTSFLIKLGLIFSIGTTFYPILEESERLRHLAQTWVYAAQWWLVGPSEKLTRNLDGIQVFCLLLVSRKTNTIGPSPWLSTGSLLRMAMTMGLHRDPRVFPGLAPFQAEIRSRLWTTILELVVHESIDSSSMPLMISPQDFDSHIPNNINDADLWPDTKEFPTVKPLQQFTESSIQLLMRQSLPIRMEAAKLINSSDSEQSYSAVLQLATDLQKACCDLATYFQLHWPQYSGETDLHRKFLDMQIRRYILLLHRPYMLQAQQDPRFYLSRKICGESAMIIASYAESIQLPSQHLDDLSRLMVMSTGPFCGSLHLDIITVLGLEVISQLKETTTVSSETGHLIVDPLGEMSKAQREPMIRILEHINDQMLQIVALGIARFKRYILLSVVLCQIRALESGARDIRPLRIKAVQESVKNCYMASQSSQSDSTPQSSIETLICTESPLGLDFDLMDPDLDFSAFFAHFSGGGGDGDYCDVYLTHDSMSVRKAHNAGRNHLRNVLEYYQQIGQEKAQSVIDSITSSYAAEGQAVPNPAMAPPGAFPPPFPFPGRPGQLPPPPFGFPPPGGPNGVPGMPPPPGAKGLPFPPPFPPGSGAPGSLPPLPNMPAGNAPFPPPPGGFPPNFQMPAPGAPGFPPMPGVVPGQPGFSPSSTPGINGPPGQEGGYAPPPGAGSASLPGPPPGLGEPR
ncbi:hypothetical protein BDV32DRAFT_149838 [Aspergillus pseudonomiae]|nr:hypothetical protein BDV32DRAFT_149838 [Aspergillus pseudonomiae]